MPEFIVQPYAASDRERWDSFVDNSKNGTFLLRRNFMEYHADRFMDASTIVTNEQGKLLALFPANLDGSTLASHGGLTYGGMICDQTMGAPAAIDIFAAWFAYWTSRGVAAIIYKSVPPFYHVMPADEDRYALFHHGAELYRCDVTSVVDLNHQGPVQARRQRGARKAKKAGLVVRESDDFSDFHEVVSHNLMARHQRRPVHTADELRLLQSRFPVNIRLFAVYAGDALLAGTLLFFCGQAIHAQYIASRDEAREQGALDLLFLSLIDTFRGSARFFDFGNSNEQEGQYLNRGLCEFKEGFGARSIVQDFFRIDLGKWNERAENV
ncbi:MAG: GNAT family N-acetyltransferase [Proteobacteria bacterium]|nr:GNAT family N-acetyltransferase [Pseudomonadota bacterium]